MIRPLASSWQYTITKKVNYVNHFSDTWLILMDLPEMTTESQSYHQSLKLLAIMAGKYTIQASSKSLMCHFIVYLTHVMYDFVLYIPS